MALNISWFLPKVVAHKRLYKKVTGKKLNLKNPVDFNEKLQFLLSKKYGKKEGELADKYLVKRYVQSLKVVGLRVPKTLAIYNNVKDINMDDLPDKFVLKCNHGSGDVFVCKDKRKFDLEHAKKILDKNMRENFAKRCLEYHYSYIKPLIMAEEYLNDGAHVNPLDYKFYCFDGKVKGVLVCSNRENGLKLNHFDNEWNDTGYVLEKYKQQKTISKPKDLRKMIRIAEELSGGIPFVRVDLYDIKGDIYFGEYTFTPAAGLIYYYSEKGLKELGDLLDLDLYD